MLELDVPWLDGIVRAKRPQRLPVVLTREEVRLVLQRLDGVPRLMACLLYGAGLRLLECCRLRVQDVDFAANQIVVRGGKSLRTETGPDVVNLQVIYLSADPLVFRVCLRSAAQVGANVGRLVDP